MLLTTTLFFFYKNLFYKNMFKNIWGWYPENI